MMQDILSVREITQDDIGTLIQYWFRADHEFLKGMGVDVGKMPSPDQFSEMLERQINTPIESRVSYCLIWELNGRAVGHTNTNPTKYGEEAFMHLHLWNIMDRKKGIG